MNRRISLRPLVLLVWIATCLGASAALVRPIAFDLPENPVALTLVHEASGNIVEVELRRNRIGDPQVLAPGRYLGRSEQFEGESAFVVPAEAGRLLLLILPRADGGCHLLPLPDDAGRFGPGDRFALNATADEIAIRFGEQRVRLPPTRSTHLRPPNPAPADGRIEVEMFRLDGEQWIPFNSTYWPLDPLARSFVLIHPDPRTGRPRVSNLSEVPREE